MKKKSHIRQKTYHCGPQNKKTEYIEVDIFSYTETTAIKQRKRKELVSPPKQQNLNDKNARRYFALLVKSNFTANDIHLVITYNATSRPESIETAEKEMSNFLRRLRTLYKKHGIEKLDYVYVTETGKKGTNIHHHVLLKNVGIDRDSIEACWNRKGIGWANARRIVANEKGIENLANYLQKEAAGKKRWKNSKGLTRPWVSTSDDKYSRKKIDKLAQLPADCEAVRQHWENQFPGYQLYECQHAFNSVTAQWSIYLKLRLRR